MTITSSLSRADHLPTFGCSSSSMARCTHPLTLPMTCSRSIHLSPLYMTISSTGLLSPLVSNSWVVFLRCQLLPYLNLPEPGRKSAKPPERISGVSNIPAVGKYDRTEEQAVRGGTDDVCVSMTRCTMGVSFPGLLKSAFLPLHASSARG